MKSKDQIHAENRALKQQLAKTAEVITKVQEAEKSLVQKMVRSKHNGAYFVGGAGASIILDRGDTSDFGEETHRKRQEGNRTTTLYRKLNSSSNRAKITTINSDNRRGNRTETTH